MAQTFENGPLYRRKGFKWFKLNFVAVCGVIFIKPLNNNGNSDPESLLARGFTTTVSVLCWQNNKRTQVPYCIVVDLCIQIDMRVFII